MTVGKEPQTSHIYFCPFKEAKHAVIQPTGHFLLGCQGWASEHPHFLLEEMKQAAPGITARRWSSGELAEYYGSPSLPLNEN